MKVTIPYGAGNYFLLLLGLAQPINPKPIISLSTTDQLLKFQPEQLNAEYLNRRITDYNIEKGFIQPIIFNDCVSSDFFNFPLYQSDLERSINNCTVHLDNSPTNQVKHDLKT